MLLAAGCFMQLRWLLRHPSSGVVYTPREAPCGRPHSLHQTLAAQRLVQQPSAQALVEAVTSGVEGATWLQIGANTTGGTHAALNENDPVIGLPYEVRA